MCLLDLLGDQRLQLPKIAVVDAEFIEAPTTATCFSVMRI
jgi:hypothetical protein